MNQNLTTRRVFLQRSLAILAAAGTVPTFLDQTVLALADPADLKRTQQPSGKDGKILVVVQLAGGNDALNTVIPFADDAYQKARPALAYDGKSVLKIDDAIGLHPNLAGLRGLLDDGKLAIVQGVGYPNPNRSHFRSMDIWHTAEPQKEIHTGWLGRYFDNTCKGDDPRNDPHLGVTIGETQPLAMVGEKITPLNFARPESYRYNGRDGEKYAALNKPPQSATQPAAAQSAIRNPKSAIPSNLDFLHRTAMDAQLSSDRIIRLSRSHTPGVEYPRTQFGNSLKTVSALIAGGLPTRVYYVSLGGFDTHANQRGRHEQLMTELAGGLAAFCKDLKQQGNDSRTLVMTFSEFGRRVAQNASTGTDHGAAAAMFLIGPAVKNGLIGKHPSLTDLDRGDLKHTTDFRSVYAAILENWLETPSKPILGGQFTPAAVWAKT